MLSRLRKADLIVVAVLAATLPAIAQAATIVRHLDGALRDDRVAIRPGPARGLSAVIATPSGPRALAQEGP